MALRIIERGDNVREAEEKTQVKKKMKKKDEKYEAIFKDIEDSSGKPINNIDDEEYKELE